MSYIQYHTVPLQLNVQNSLWQNQTMTPTKALREKQRMSSLTSLTLTEPAKHSNSENNRMTSIYVHTHPHHTQNGSEKRCSLLCCMDGLEKPCKLHPQPLNKGVLQLTTTNGKAPQHLIETLQVIVKHEALEATPRCPKRPGVRA